MKFASFFQRFRDRKRKDEELAEEIDSHLAHEQDAISARGLSSEEAHRQARVKFGNPYSTRERVWRYRSLTWVEDARRDLGFAIRSLGKTPGLTAIAILVMAVGIGVNTAVFSVINTVLLKPLTYPDAQSLVQLMNTGPQGSTPIASGPTSMSGVSRPVFSSRSLVTILAAPGVTSLAATPLSRYKEFMSPLITSLFGTHGRWTRFYERGRQL